MVPITPTPSLDLKLEKIRNAIARFMWMWCRLCCRYNVDGRKDWELCLEKGFVDVCAMFVLLKVY
jgi:hypothetical protein